MSPRGPIRTDIPWFKEFVAETLSDLRYLALSDAGKGQRAHLRLLCWRHGSIPADEATLSRPPYCSEPVLPEVLALFSKRGNRLFDPALERQRTVYVEKCQKNRDNGHQGGRPKKTQEVNENRSVSDGLADGLRSLSDEKPEEKREEEKRDEKPLARVVLSRSAEPNNAGASPTPLSVEKNLGETARRMGVHARSGKSDRELAERRRELDQQGELMKKKFGGPR